MILMFFMIIVYLAVRRLVDTVCQMIHVQISIINGDIIKMIVNILCGVRGGGLVCASSCVYVCAGV